MTTQPNHKHCCVIDSTGSYITFVLLLLVPDLDGNEQWQIQYYTLKEGEQLIDTLPPANILKAKWDFETTSWQETATAEELAEAEKDKPVFAPPPPTPEQQRISDLETALALQQQVTDSLLISALEV